MGLLCAKQSGGNLQKLTFKNYGTPVRRTKRRNSKQKSLSGILTPVRRTKRRKSQQIDFQEFWDSCAQNKTSEISKNTLFEIIGLQCAEQNVGHLKTWTFMNAGTPVRRTKRRKSQKLHFHKFWHSGAQRRPSAAPPLWFPLYWL